jgi:AmmeMemoRadiSam system protein B
MCSHSLNVMCRQNESSILTNSDFNHFRCPHEFTIVPILVGSLSVQNEIQYGRFFSKYLSDPENFFVISSDFCHWGKSITPIAKRMVASEIV